MERQGTIRGCGLLLGALGFAVTAIFGPSVASHVAFGAGAVGFAWWGAYELIKACRPKVRL